MTEESEWLKVMLSEIHRKRDEEREALAEAERRQPGAGNAQASGKVAPKPGR